MKLKLRLPKNSQGVVLPIAMCILLAITAIGVGMITNAAMSSTIAKNYKNKIQSFYASDGQMTAMAQSVIDSTDSGWISVTSFSSNMVQNGDFSQGSAAWQNSDTTHDGNVPFDYSAGYVSIPIYTGGQQWTPELRASTPVKLGKTYTVCFDAKADVSRSINVQVWNGANRGLNFTPTITTSWTTYTSVFTANKEDMGAQLHFDVGLTAGSVQLDNIIMVQGSSCKGVPVGGRYKIRANNNNLYVVLGGGLLNATGADSASGATFQTVANGNNYKIKDVSSGNFVALDGSYQLTATATEGAAMEFGLPPCEYTGGDGGVAILAVNKGDTNNYVCAGTGPGTVLKAIMRACTTTVSTCLTRFFFKLVNRDSTAQDTVTMGDFKVAWKISRTPGCINCFNLTTNALKYNSKWGIIFQTPLSQYIERAGAAELLPVGPTLKIPVTFYDFHSNRTNPEFEQPCINAIRTGMVATTLDAQRKPQLGPNPCLNYGIAKWFRSWTAGDTVIPVYRYTTLQYTTQDSTAVDKTLKRWRRLNPFHPWGCPPAGVWYANCPGEWGNAACNEISSPADGQNPINEKTGGTVPRVDTAFKDSVIPDTLTFNLIDPSTGTYQFNVTQNFFPLDNRGFGNEWNTNDQKQNDSLCESKTGSWSHNFSFTMEMHDSFTMVSGLNFYFSGDDDIWLFINNRLQMDLGGPHAQAAWNISVDTVKDGGGVLLVKGLTYKLDFFYAERHSAASHCTITTNMLTPGPPTKRQRQWQRSYGLLD